MHCKQFMTRRRHSSMWTNGKETFPLQIRSCDGKELFLEGHMIYRDTLTYIKF